MQRHWSFILCDKKYVYPFSLLLFTVGLIAAFKLKDPTQLSRVGNFIIGVGVWMSMRCTLREGINKHKDFSGKSPTVPGTNHLNENVFNQITFSISDTRLQIHWFVLVVLGSGVGSYGDMVLKCFFPGHF